MRHRCLFFACILSVCIAIPAAFAFYTDGQVTAEIDYENIEIVPPEIACDKPIVKGDPYEAKCLPKIMGRLTYAFTEDQFFKATLVFYNIFSEIVAEAEIEERLRWKEGYVDFVDFVYIYPDYDFDALTNSHTIRWEVHEQINKTSADNHLYIKNTSGGIDGTP